MPYVNIKAAGKLTKKQKKEISRQFSQTLSSVANKKKEETYIVFDEVSGKNWSVGDKFFA